MLNLFGSKQIDDEVFGKIEYQRYLFHYNFWKGRIYFSPISNEIDIYIVADNSGVLKSQREFF